MKKLLPVLLALLTANSVHSQSITWSSPVTVAPGSSGNMHPRLALDKTGNPLVLWGSSSMGGQAMFARWNGTAFSTPIALNPMSMPVFAIDWAGPDMAAKGDTVYAVFKHTPETDSTKHIYITRSLDGGQNFSAPVRVDYIGNDLSRFPSITVDDAGNPVVAFMRFDASFGDARWVVASSNDLGNSFQPDVLASSASNEVCDCCPSTILSKANTRIALYRNNLSNIRTMWAGISTNGGSNFSPISVDNTNWMIMSCPSSGPDGIIAGDTLHTVFMSQGGGSARVYRSKTVLSTNTLASTAQITGPITGLTQQNFPRIASAGSSAVIAWRQTVSGTTQLALSFANSISGGFPSTPEVVAIGAVANTDVAMTTGVVHVVWQDNTSGTVMYRKGTYTSGIHEAATNPNGHLFYPNPARQEITIASKDVKECYLFDVTGKQIVPTFIHKGDVTLVNLSAVPIGNYFIRTVENDGQAWVDKLTVE